MKRIHVAVLGALAMGFAGAGVAQGGVDPMIGSDSGSTISKSSQSQDLSSSYKSSDLLGMNVTNRQNETLGSFSELIVDKDGKVSHVVLSESATGDISGNKYLVPWDRVQLDAGQNVAIIDVPRDTLTSEFAAFDENMTATVKGSKSGSSSTMPKDSGSGSMPSGGSSGSY